MGNGYWDSFGQRRITRRRALATTGAGMAAATLLAACGGGNDGSGSGGGDKANLVTKPADTTSQAKRDGVIKDRLHTDAAALDVAQGITALNAITSHTHSTLVMVKPGYLQPAENELAPDIIESWEWAGDGLSITMKLRQNVTFHNKAPVSGRTLDADDVVFSWQRFAAKGASRSAIVNSVNAQAPVLSITAQDSGTLVMKLKEPVVYALALFTPTTTGYPLIVPKETDTTYDAKTDVIGTGPYFLSKYEPSIGFTFERNPAYWDKDYALAAKIEMPIVGEYSSALSQFKAGNIYSFGSYVNTPKISSDDLLPVKKETRAINIYKGEIGNPPGQGTRILIFGWLPEGKSPFVDERVRQAISMAQDRDLYIETFFNTSKFESEGLDVESRWNTALLSEVQGWWLDPKGKDFGPNAKYFKHDLPEAKKLMAAAGFPNGFPVTANYVTSNELVTAKHAEVIDGMVAELGFKVTVRSLDYNSEYIPQLRNGRGQFEGWGFKSAAGGATGGDPIGMLANEYWSKVGVTFHGFSASGKNDMSGDPYVESQIDKGRVERDTEKRRQIVFDLQRYLAGKMYAINPPGQASGFSVAWPALANFNVYQGARQNYKLWVDNTKAPFKS